MLSDPASYFRSDCGVLYVTNDAARTVNSVLREEYHHIAPFLRPSIPALTKWLAPGISAALDPDNGDSFGTNRCKLLATHILTSLHGGLDSASKRVSFVVDRLESDGVSVSAPYLNAGYADPFCTFLAQPSAPRSRNEYARLHSDPIPANSFRMTAIKIGMRLAQSAYWSGDSCNWVAEKNPWASVRMGGMHPVTYEALNVDIYGGTSGVALFLAELAKLCGIELVARSARGAMINSLRRLRSCLGALSTGLYTGWPGVLLAGAYVGAVLPDPLITNMTLELWSHYRQQVVEGSEFDLLSGDAGAIIALIGLENLRSCPGALKLAEKNMVIIWCCDGARHDLARHGAEPLIRLIGRLPASPMVLRVLVVRSWSSIDALMPSDT